MQCLTSTHHVIRFTILAILLNASFSHAQNTFPTNGDVGVGTANPSEPLSVESTNTYGTALGIHTAGIGQQALLSFYEQGTQTWQLGKHTDGTFFVWDANATRFVLDAIPAGALGLMPYGGSVGIGTMTPAYTLDVAGQIHTSGGIVFPDGTSQNTAASSNGTSYSTITQSNGNIGIGTTTPLSGLDVFSFNNESAGGIRFGGSETFDAFLGFAYLNPPGTDVLRISRFDHGTNNNRVDFIGINALNGDVGIGTTSPGAQLEVNGSIKLTSGSGASMTFADGTVQSTAWNGTTLGGDYAEAVDVLGERSDYEPGDVIVMDPSEPGKFTKSAGTYSKLVAGVYSTKPGLVGRRLTVPRVDKAAEVPMAMVGIAPTKVSAENGPIEVGDLLVSSSMPGIAMKGTDPARLTGAIIGKALAPLQLGTGVVEVMISIQ